MKDFLAFIGMVFLTITVLMAVAVIGLFYDSLGMISLPEEVRQVPATLSAMDEVKVTVQDASGEVVWSSPLDVLPNPTMPVFSPTETPIPEPIAPEPVAVEPTATLFPTATASPYPTSTPVPPLDPEVYRVEVTARLKAHAAALQRWLGINEALGLDDTRRNDPAWRQEMNAVLLDVATSGRALAEVGPPPAEYESIDALLDRVAQEAEGLAWNYRQGIEAGDASFLQAAGENFVRLKAHLKQAAELMVEKGWDLSS